MTTILGLDLGTVIHLIRRYQTHGLDVYELDRVRQELEEEKRKNERLVYGLEKLLRNL